VKLLVITCANFTYTEQYNVSFTDGSKLTGLSYIKRQTMVLVHNHRLQNFGTHGDIHSTHNVTSAFTLIFSPAVLAVNRAARDAMVMGMMMQFKKG